MAIEVDYQNQKITINGVDIVSANGVIADNVFIQPTASVTSNTLSGALEEIGKRIYYQDTPPLIDVKEAAMWYETDTENLYIYRETSPTVFNWVPIIFGTGTSDIIDGGSY